jgi:N-acetylmuramoyl-L-alanine amidase
MSQTDRARNPRVDTMPWTGAVRVTVPIVLAGALTVGMGVAAPADAAHAAVKKSPKAQGALRAVTPASTSAARIVPAATAVVPLSHTVASGETVSGIAGRYGLATAAVLAANGLGWKSLIHPGQVLVLPGGTAAPAATPAATTVSAAGGYTVARGDTMSGIAQRFGVTTAALLAANHLTGSSIIYPGQRIVVPGATPAAPAAKPAAPAAKPAAPAAGGSYTIRTGDTVSAIAAAHGVTTAAVLAANGLTSGSLIYAGRTLTIPSSAPAATAIVPAAAVTPISSTTVTGLTPEMATNARTIIRVGRSLGVPDRGIVIALATAMQESGLVNLSTGHLDSVGLFQQRPSKGWGTVAQLTDPAASALRFYGGPSNPNKGVTRGLLDVKGWQAMTVTQAAQAVQVSAYPDAYARWEASATSWLRQLG